MMFNNILFVFLQVMCKAYYFAHYMSLTIPVVLLSVISVERYIAILYPLKAKQLFTFKRLRITQVLIWLILAAYNSPQLIVHDTFTLGGKTFCYMRSDNINTNAYVLANLIVWYILPLFILSFMYCKIATTLWQSSSTQNFALNPQCNQKFKNNIENNPRSLKHHHPHCLSSCSSSSSCGQTAATSSSAPDYSRQIEMFEMSEGANHAISSNTCRLCHCGSFISQVETEVEYMSEVTDGESNSEIYSNDSGGGSRLSGGSGTEKMARRPCEVNLTENSLKFKRRGLNKDETQRTQFKTGSLSRSNNARFVTVGLRGHCHRKRPCANTQKVIQSRKKVIRLLLMIIGTFAVLALPYHIRACIYLWADTTNMGSLLSPICYLLYYTNSGLNPLLYAFLSDNFRKSLRDSFKCFSRK